MRNINASLFRYFIAEVLDSYIFRLELLIVKFTYSFRLLKLKIDILNIFKDLNSNVKICYSKSSDVSKNNVRT